MNVHQPSEQHCPPTPKPVLLITGLPMPWAVFTRTWCRLLNQKDKWELVEEAVKQLGGNPSFVPPRGVLWGIVRWLAFFPVIGLRRWLAKVLINTVGPSKHTGVEPAVIAHSFGTVILAKAVKISPDLRLDRAVLFGSVVTPRFPWNDHLREENSQNLAVNDYRNITGRRDWMLPLAWIVERIERCLPRSWRLIGRAGISGFFCCESTSTTPCERHNRNRDEYGHSDAVNLADLDRWLYFLGCWPKYNSFQLLQNTSPEAFNEALPRGLSDKLLQYLKVKPSPQAILVEGQKGSGKSYLAIYSLRALFQDKCEDRYPIYYLNAQYLESQTQVTQVKQDLAALPPGAVLLFDDIHKSVYGPESALWALTNCRARLFFVSRDLASEPYLRLRRKFSSDRARNHILFPMPASEDNQEELCKFIGDILRMKNKAHSPDNVSMFYKYYRDDLTALFDAIDIWISGNPVTERLADQATRRRMESDTDFHIEHHDQEKVYATYLAASAFSMFEMPIKHTYFGDALDLPSNIAVILADRRVLRKGGEEARREYQLDHELRAERNLRVASQSEDFTRYLRQKFRERNICKAEDPELISDHLLFLDLLRPATEPQISRLSELHRRLLYRGYTQKWLQMTDTFRKNLHLLDLDTRVELLVLGSGMRRRFKTYEDAKNWLEEAKQLDQEINSGRAQARILYEEGYCEYNDNKFDDAEGLFKRSADLSVNDEVGRHMSLAQAVEAQFQAAVLNDPFTRNLGATAPPQQEQTMEKLAVIRKTLEDYLDQFEHLATVPSDRQGAAKRWTANCLWHLVDVCIEKGEEKDAEKFIEQCKCKIEKEHYFSIEPVLTYLEGRLRLVQNQESVAIPLLEKAWEGYKAEIRENEELGDLLIALGDAYHRAGAPRPANDCYTKTRDLGRYRRHGRAVSAAQNRLGEK